MDEIRSRRVCRTASIVTHEIEFVPVIVFGGMDCYFCRRQREDQPSVASVHGRKSENVPQEGAVSRRISAVHDHMRTKDHKLCPSPPIIRDGPDAAQANGKT